MQTMKDTGDIKGMTDVQKKLFEMQDLRYRDFHSKLMPTVDKEKVIGVRTPDLRRFAKEYWKAPESRVFINKLPHSYYEENNLHAFLIEEIKDYDEAIMAIEQFLPYIDNWATCDMMSPKILKKNLDKLLTNIERWITSDNTYMIRYAIVTLMKYYLEDNSYKPEYMDMVLDVKSDEYYIKMAVAWYMATALAKQYNQALKALEEERLDVCTHNKTIQKAIESYRVSSEQKAYLKTLKKVNS